MEKDEPLGVDFTNVFRARFSYERLSLVTFCEKRAQKALVKSTLDGRKSIENIKDNQIGQVTPKKYIFFLARSFQIIFLSTIFPFKSHIWNNFDNYQGLHPQMALECTPNLNKP